MVLARLKAINWLLGSWSNGKGSFMIKKVYCGWLLQSI